MRVRVCDCGDMTCPRSHPTPTLLAAGQGARRPTYPPQYCVVCDSRLSRYNQGPSCWRHGP